MIVTDEKIVVTFSMMARNNMTRGDQFGIPTDPKSGTGGLQWKSLGEMEDEDFDKIEEYFMSKGATPQH